MEAHKLAEIRAREDMPSDPKARRKPFGHEWGISYWVKWAAIANALRELGLTEGATVLDVGVGTGWTTVFLAEEGYCPTGVDIAPTSAVVGAARAERYGVDAVFETVDMDSMDLGKAFDACLVFDALHHSLYQRTVVERIAAHLKPGGWVLFGEPSWLHGVSPDAIRTSKETGWVERGIKVRRLRRDCRAAGLGNFRRFYEGATPSGGVGGVLWQACRLTLSLTASSPQGSIWIAAQRQA